MKKLRKSEATRNRILDAANKVLRNESYYDVRLATIAKAAGTHAGAMYYYFESKDALIEALLNRNAARWLELIISNVEALPDSASYREKLIAVAETSFAAVLGDNEDNIVFMRLINDVPADMRRRLLIHPRNSRNFIKDLFRKGQEAGEFRADINPSMVSLMLLSNLIWSFDWFEPDAHKIKEMVHAMCDIVLRGIES